VHLGVLVSVVDWLVGWFGGLFGEEEFPRGAE